MTGGSEMVVCHCKLVNDRTVADAIRAGADCPTSLAAHCGAGSDCGGCLPTLEDLLDRELGPAV